MNKDKILLVTGGAGFIGSNLIEALCKNYPDHEIASLDNYFTGKVENHILAPNVRYLKGNTIDIVKIWKKSRLAKPRIIFHLGEYSRIVQSFEDIDTVWNFNVNGTKAVLKFSLDNKSKFVYAGSSSKFGNNGEDENLSPYAWIKAKNVESIKNWHMWFGGPDYVITYFYNVYGPRQIKEGKYATLIGIFEKQYEKGKPLTVVSPGTQTRDFTHVSDIVNGIIICAEKGSGDGYQLGVGKEKTILDIAKMFGTKINFIPVRKGERTKGKATSTKALELGWKPVIKIEDYIRKFVKTV